MVTIIPNPKKYHFYWEQGEISDRWFRRMGKYIRAMYKRERITEAEMNAALIDKPRFYKPGPEDPVLREKEIIPFQLGDPMGMEPALDAIPLPDFLKF